MILKVQVQFNFLQTHNFEYFEIRKIIFQEEADTHFNLENQEKTED